MRFILEKHVVRPKILQAQQMMDIKDAEMPKRISDEMQLCIKGINHFMGKYFESVK